MAGKKGSVAVMEYQLLQAATNNFREDNVLGQGGHGCVYKARFSEKLLAAVKRFEGEAQDIGREFEVMFFMKLIWILFQSIMASLIFPFFSFQILFVNAERAELVNENSAPKHNFSFRLLPSWWNKVSCVWNDAEWVFGKSIAWYKSSPSEF